MQDAAQYGAVEASSPPPKRFGRKTVVALAALGLAGVAALSLGPQKKIATGLVVKYTGESRGKSDCGGLDWFCPFMCAGNRNNYNTKRCCRCFPAPPPPPPKRFGRKTVVALAALGLWKSARSYARATSSPLPTPSSAASVPRRPRSAEPTAAPAPRAQERVPLPRSTSLSDRSPAALPCLCT